MSLKLKNSKGIIIFAISLVLILTTLFAGNNVILTDNGDFGRVTRLCSLEKNTSGELKIVLQDQNILINLKNILFTPDDISTYPSSQLIAVRVSVAASYLINTVCGLPKDTYNIFYLGMMLGLLYAAALGFTLSKINIKNKFVFWSVAVITLFIMCDIGYVSYFNSLYGEGLQHILFVALFGFILIIIQRPFKMYETVVFAVLLILYGQSKFFNIPVAVLMGLIFLIFSSKHKPDRKNLMINIITLVLSVVILLYTMNLLPAWISEQTNYNAIFYGIVKDCDDEKAKEYLQELDINPELYCLKNSHYYVSNINEIEQNYDITAAKNISQMKLMMFYAKHPLMTFSKMPEIAQHSGVLRNIFFMDEDYMNHPMRCSLWSKLRENIDMDTVYLNLTIIAVLLILMVVMLIKHNMPLYVKISMPVVVVMAFAYSFIVPYVSNGEADLAKHMYLFVELIDVAVIAILLLVINSAVKIQRATGVIFAIMLIAGLIPGKSMDTVVMGGYEWCVIDENSSYRTLIAKESVAQGKYHSVNDNNYKTSDIHKWLNETFVNCFSEKEKEQLYVKNEQIVLSTGYKTNATSGNRDYYCSPYPKTVSTNYDSAYKEVVTGSVFLPTSKHISMMASKGYKTTSGSNYWLSTPYFNNSEKSRYVNRDGLVYFEYTSEKMGIRPVIYIKTK